MVVRLRRAEESYGGWGELRIETLPTSRGSLSRSLQLYKPSRVERGREGIEREREGRESISKMQRETWFGN